MPLARESNGSSKCLHSPPPVKDGQAHETKVGQYTKQIVLRYTLQCKQILNVVPILLIDCLRFPQHIPVGTIVPGWAYADIRVSRSLPLELFVSQSDVPSGN